MNLSTQKAIFSTCSPSFKASVKEDGNESQQLSEVGHKSQGILGTLSHVLNSSQRHGCWGLFLTPTPDILIQQGWNGNPAIQIFSVLSGGPDAGDSGTGFGKHRSKAL